MNDDDFQHHVNSEKNDFMNWILHVLKDKHFANLLSDIKTKEEMLNIIQERIDNYEKILMKQKKPKLDLFAPKDNIVKSNNMMNPSREELHKEMSNTIINTSYMHEMTPNEVRNELKKEFIKGLILGIIIGLLVYTILLY